MTRQVEWGWLPRHQARQMLAVELELSVRAPSDLKLVRVRNNRQAEMMVEQELDRLGLQRSNPPRHPDVRAAAAGGASQPSSSGKVGRLAHQASPNGQPTALDPGSLTSRSGLGAYDRAGIDRYASKALLPVAAPEHAVKCCLGKCWDMIVGVLLMMIGVKRAQVPAHLGTRTHNCQSRTWS